MKESSTQAGLPVWQSALIAGSAASVLSGLVLAWCSRGETGSAAAALNAPSQWVWGEHEAYTQRATWRHTLTGYAIHHAMSIFWAGLHACAFTSSPPTRPAAAQCPPATAAAPVVEDAARSGAHGSAHDSAQDRNQGSTKDSAASIARHCAQAAATTMTAYVVDYHLVPARLRPGFKKHLGPASMLASYTAFATGLALGFIACARAGARAD